MDEGGKIDGFDPTTIILFIMALASDFIFFGLFGFFIPYIGFAIVLYVFGAHYLLGLILFGFFWGKTKGWLPKMLLGLAWAIPLPLLTIGLFLAIVASNPVGAFLVEQGAAIAIGAATAGAGAVAVEGAEAGVVAAEGVEAAATVAEGAEAAATAGEAVSTGAESVEAGVSATGEAAGETFENPLDRPMETTGSELNEPSETQFHEGEGVEANEGPGDKEGGGERERGNKVTKGVKKVFDIADRANQAQEKDEEDKGEDSEAEYFEDAA